MIVQGDWRPIPPRSASLALVAMVALLASAPMTVPAAQSSAAVGVAMTVQTGLPGVPPDTASCTLVGAFGATVSVSCTPGDVRFLVMAPPQDQFLFSPVTSESETRSRIGTCWRKVNTNGREYFEVMVRW